MTSGRLLAISDLHVRHPENRAIVEDLRPGDPGDWLLVAGDVGEIFADIEWALGVLAARFARVIWVPGNHELWSHSTDPQTARGERRYQLLVDMCRGLGVLTPEDPYPVWDGSAGAAGAGRAHGEGGASGAGGAHGEGGAGGAMTIVPLFLGYDYSFRPEGTRTKEEALAYAYDTGVVCTDESLLHPDPYPSREAWCHARISGTERRLAAELDPALPVIFVNHYPLVREPTRILRYPQFAQWCGTDRTADWHTRYNTAAVVYGHLHIPRVTHHDGVRFEEVSVGYPREWRRRAQWLGVAGPSVPWQIMPPPEPVPLRPGVPAGMRG